MIARWKNLHLPATEKRKQFELRALACVILPASKANKPSTVRLARFARLLVVDSIASRDFRLGRGRICSARLRMNGQRRLSKPLPNGWRLVILNPAHGPARNRATLMEEVAHVFSVTSRIAWRLFGRTRPRGPRPGSPAGVGGKGRCTNQQDSRARVQPRG